LPEGQSSSLRQEHLLVLESQRFPRELPGQCSSSVHSLQEPVETRQCLYVLLGEQSESVLHLTHLPLAAWQYL
jgi:hypothetical protein